MSVDSQEKRMEVSMKKCRQNGGSPFQVVPELSPEAQARQRAPKRVSVVYYLCRNGHLEHPHFIEVPLSSAPGLLLKDIIERLNAVRGNGMLAFYSWSCKRSYGNGFVWHDLCENDMICPTNGNEYILKGSELLEGTMSPTPALNFTSVLIDCQRQLRGNLPPVVLTNQDDEPSSTSASSPSTDDGKLSQAQDFPPPAAVDASTQTTSAFPEVCARVVSTEEADTEDADRDEGLERDEQVVTDPVLVSVSSSSKEKPETIESFKVSNQKPLSMEGGTEPAWAESSKSRVTDMIMQLISCGAISIRSNGHRFIPAYQQRKSPVESRKVDDPARFLLKSGSSRKADMLSEKPRHLFIGPERSSYNSQSCKSVAEEESPEPEEKRAQRKCIPLTTRSAKGKPAKCSIHGDHDPMRLSDSASDAGGCRGSPEIFKHTIAALPDGQPSARLEGLMEEEKKAVGT